MDIFWCLTMEHVWAGRPAKNPKGWLAFRSIRSIVLSLSWVEVVIKLMAVALVSFIYHGASAVNNSNNTNFPPQTSNANAMMNQAYMPQMQQTPGYQSQMYA